MIAATNRDLRGEFATNAFRQDLYFRLAVFEIPLPPLHRRREDIPQLAERFLQNLIEAGQPACRLSEAALAELCRRRWLGNVRELRNAVEHGALLARGGSIAPEHLPAPLETTLGNDSGSVLERAVREWVAEQLAAGESQADLYQRFLTQVEPPLFDTVLEATGQNRAAAAEWLGIHRATLRKKLN